MLLDADAGQRDAGRFDAGQPCNAVMLSCLDHTYACYIKAGNGHAWYVYVLSGNMAYLL
jgi:hypothetical protein